MIERYLEWLDNQRFIIAFLGFTMPIILFMVALTIPIIVLGNVFGWFTTETSTHLNGHCEQFYQYILVGKQLVLESVNVCP